MVTQRLSAPAGAVACAAGTRFRCSLCDPFFQITGATGRDTFCQLVIRLPPPLAPRDGKRSDPRAPPQYWQQNSSLRNKLKRVKATALFEVDKIL